MPGAINGAEAYSELKALQRYAFNNKVWENTPQSLQERTRWFLSGHGPDIQFKRDVALWYGAITDCGEPWKGEFLLRVFGVLYWGGLMVNRGTEWESFCTQRIPICSTISHTARVLIQLPESDDGEFWDWLWGDEEPRRRMAATHGIGRLPQPVTIGNVATKKVEELKHNRNVKHFGVNIALGGCGNRNIISGREIDHQSGGHGHLYIAYTGDTPQFSPKALLIGAEQSAPFDRSGRKQGGIGGALLNLLHRKRGLRQLIFGVSDNYGGKHSILGGHSRYSSTGGDDFAYTSKVDREGEVVRRIDGANLYGYGPSTGNYYDGMFIELTTERFERIKKMQAAGRLSPDLVGKPGGPIIPSIEGRTPRREIPVVVDLRNRRVIR
ncbi:hypothetical protein [Desulfosarcina ovata]|uniref:Uncharacterized protein n=1 Tax=Desulfosarcina ovata subsp. ovata TaxID=2752305 RepID=A0A5K8A8H2_9BACT|nr:hypothetical protein [Desulfosarcina ovata]BBO88766.1 hypothetical protein DSCOOX_19460 [Desulfosarcina ovata subsp. ovata]